MRALRHDPTTSSLAIGEVPDPVPGVSQALIEVRTAGLNFLDVAYRQDNFAAGEVPGVDAAGVVITAAADGSGPPVGARVVGFGYGGAFAERRAMTTVDLAVVPDGVELGAAVCLPGAGTTALQAIRALGTLLGRRVLITGASGGVGRFAVQLAHLAGAEVIAVVGAPARGEGLAGLGADLIVTDLAGLDPVDAVIDNVGGSLLADAVGMTRAGGTALSIGQASGRPTSFDFEAERRRGGFVSVLAFRVASPFGPDLDLLLRLLDRGRLDPQIGWRGSWSCIDEAAAALTGRSLRGKAVLDID